jgi:hypothetical protein
VWFDGASALRAVSRPFFFHRYDVEFALGLAWRADGTTLAVTYGVEDKEAWIATVEADDVRALLADPAHLPPGVADWGGAGRAPPAGKLRITSIAEG